MSLQSRLDAFMRRVDSFLPSLAARIAASRWFWLALTGWGMLVTLSVFFPSYTWGQLIGAALKLLFGIMMMAIGCLMILTPLYVKFLNFLESKLKALNDILGGGV